MAVDQMYAQALQEIDRLEKELARLREALNKCFCQLEHNAEYSALVDEIDDALAGGEEANDRSQTKPR